MRTLILALCVPLLLGACQDSVGQGPPPTFSPSIQAFFEQYLNEPIPRVFVISIDGKYATYRYCTGLGDVCVGQVSATPKAITHCEEQSGGVPCKVYAFGRRIKWTGEKGSGEPRVSPTPPPSCNLPFSEAIQLDAPTQYDIANICPKPMGQIWLCRAAHSGHPDAQFRLGSFYRYSYGGLDQGLVQAYKWYQLASDKNGGTASKELEVMSLNMTPAEITEAERLVAEWEPNPAECETIGTKAVN